jgi:hypothetical protein
MALFYAILDSSGKSVDSSNDAQTAHDALEVLVRKHPGSAREYVLLTYNDDGVQVGRGVLGSDVHLRP